MNLSHKKLYARYKRTDTGEIVIVPWYTDSTDTVVEGTVTWVREGNLVGPQYDAPKLNDPAWGLKGNP